MGGVRLIEQRREGDCGLSALANYFHARYEDLYIEAVKIHPAIRKGDGLLVRHLREIAERVGRPLRVVRRCDFDTDNGVLGVLWNDTKRQYGIGHFVVLVKGQILDGADLYEEADEYLLEKNARPGWLLTED